MATPGSPEPKQRGGGRVLRPRPLSWLLLLCLLAGGPAAASLPALEYDYAVSPKFVCTPIPPEADPSCYSPPLPHGGGPGGGHGGGAGGHGGAGHNGSSRRAVMSEEAKATVLHLRESLVRQKEVILDQRETIRELTAKLTLCEGFGGLQGMGHHDNGRHNNGHHNEHNDRRGGHHGPYRDHYYPHGGHHPDPHHPDPHHPDPHHRDPHHPDPHHPDPHHPDPHHPAPHHPDPHHPDPHHPDPHHPDPHHPDPHHPPRKGLSHSKPSSFSADQTAKTLQTLKERLENLQARNSSSSYSSSLRDLLQRKINALEEQLHHHYRGHHNDHHGNARHDDHHDDHHGTGHHVDHPDDHHDDRHDNHHSNGRHDDPHDDHHDDHRGKGRLDDHHDEHHSPGHKDDHHDDHLNTGHNDKHRDDNHNSHRTNQHNNHRYPARSSHSPRPYDHHDVRHYGRGQARPGKHRDDHHTNHRGPGRHDNHRSGGSGDHHGDHHVSGHHDDHHGSGHHDDHHGSGHHDDHHGSSHHNDHHGTGHHDDHHGTGHHDDHHSYGYHDDHHSSGHHDDHHGSGHHDDHHGTGHHDDHHGSGHHDDHHDGGHHDDHQEVPRHRKKHPPVRLHYPSTPPAAPHGAGAHGKLDTVLSHLHHRTPETAETHNKTPQDPDVFQISFPVRTSYMHARMKGAVLKELFALTVCLWLRGGAGGPGLGTPFSYSVPGQANELVLIEWGSNPMELLINDKAVTLPVMLTDRKWHHVCVAWSTRDGLWEAYLDGVKKGSGENLSAWRPVKAGGVFILGQEQDSLGGRFDASQSFVGDMADLQFWSRVLAPAEVHSQASCGAHLEGDVLSWGGASVELHGGATARPFLPCH